MSRDLMDCIDGLTGLSDKLSFLFACAPTEDTAISPEGLEGLRKIIGDIRGETDSIRGEIMDLLSEQGAKERVQGAVNQEIMAIRKDFEIYIVFLKATVGVYKEMIVGGKVDQQLIEKHLKSNLRYFTDFGERHNLLSPDLIKECTRYFADGEWVDPNAA